MRGTRNRGKAMGRVKRALAAAMIVGLLGALAGCDDTGGSWDPTTTSAPAKAAHAALLPDGKVLLIEGSANNADQFAAGTFRTFVWDPAPTRSPASPRRMTCSAPATPSWQTANCLLRAACWLHTVRIAGSAHSVSVQLADRAI